ncbi:MAG: hypothetical protein IT326_04945, partial [Anaerolineae bacterium]|nr:hypothetical protein [Anaerolineae bacterium]
MSQQKVASFLTQAGVDLLNSLLDQCQKLWEATDDPTYTAIEHYVLDVLDDAAIHASLDAACREIVGHSSSYERSYAHMLTAFATLLEQGGQAVDSFGQALWRAGIFNLADAAEELWNVYPQIQEHSRLNGHMLPATWGHWAQFVQVFMEAVQNHLVEQLPTFEALLYSEDVAEILSSLGETAHAPGAPSEYYNFSKPDQFDNA